MMATMLTHLATELSSASMFASSSDSNSGWLLLLGPAGGAAMYFGMWRYYRNTDKSHSFERETRIDAKPITGQDRKVDEVKGTKKRHIDGNNATNHRQRVQRF